MLDFNQIVTDVVSKLPPGSVAMIFISPSQPVLVVGKVFTKLLNINVPLFILLLSAVK